MTNKVSGIDDSELAGLSETERAALTDDSEGDNDRAAAEEGAGTPAAQGDTDGKPAQAKAAGTDDTAGDKDDEDDDAAGAADGRASDASGATGDAAAAAADEPGDTAAADEDEASLIPRTPRIPVDPVEDFEGKIAALNTELSDALTAFKAGELEQEDYLAKQNEVQTKRDELNRAQTRADIARQHNDAADRQDWLLEVEAFMRRVRKTEGVDYLKGTVKIGDQDVKLMDEFDRHVNLLVNDPSNAERDGAWLLEEAHAIVAGRYRLARAAPATDSGKPAKSAAALPARTPAAKVPKTLSELPAAAETETGNDGEFAHLDALTGLALETAVAAMSPTAQDRWARS